MTPNEQMITEATADRLCLLSAEIHEAGPIVDGQQHCLCCGGHFERATFPPHASVLTIIRQTSTGVERISAQTYGAPDCIPPFASERVEVWTRYAGPGVVQKALTITPIHVHQSARSCGCDPGMPYLCEQHRGNDPY